MNDAAPRAHTRTSHGTEEHVTRTPRARTDANSNIVIIYNNVIDIIYNSFDSNA